MTYDRLGLEPQHLLLKCISGSRAYNLQLPHSDTDYKGVFILPYRELLGFHYTDQVSNESNDEVFYEVGRFVELLCKNNPNILELLASPPATIVVRHPLMDHLKPEMFLSKLCRDTFGGYAETQVRKARGLNKKINQPADISKKSVLDFCWIYDEGKTMPLMEWLSDQGLTQEDCGLTKLPHFRDGYLLYADRSIDKHYHFKGIISGDSANDVHLSSVPEHVPSLALMHFNKDGYSVHCREFREYAEWLEKRNESRFQETVRHGQSYDAKHMMHTFRLLNMAEEIARHKRIQVFREDREFLLKIRSGHYTFDELMEMVAEKIAIVDECYRVSDLPEVPDVQMVEGVLVGIREEFYK
jgi:uncharacterized protein